jgi:nucleotide-binding universal stress UspA family protein
MFQSLLDPALEDRSIGSRILNATSGSAASANATAAAAVIATERDAELIVLHVSPPEVVRVGRLAPTIVHNQRLQDPHSSVVLAAARQVAWANGAFARIILISGDPASAIVAVASELAVDLIVIGTKPSRAPTSLSAPTRYRIERNAPSPVSVVPLAAPKRPQAALRRAGSALRSNVGS